jgi:hypothetical protein
MKRPPDDDVTQHTDADEFADLPESPRDLQIVCARRRIARWAIVNKDNRRRIE